MSKKKEFKIETSYSRSAAKADRVTPRSPNMHSSLEYILPHYAYRRPLHPSTLLRRFIGATLLPRISH